MSVTLVEFLQNKWDFSWLTFGPKQSPIGVLDHVAKEVLEIKTDPYNPEEWIDLILLGIDGAMRSGLTPRALEMALLMKIEMLSKRQWPDWRSADPDKAIEHVRGPLEVVGLEEEEEDE